MNVCDVVEGKAGVRISPSCQGCHVSMAPCRKVADTGQGKEGLGLSPGAVDGS